MTSEPLKPHVIISEAKMYGRAVAYKGSLLPEDAGDRDINAVGVRDVTRVWY